MAQLKMYRLPGNIPEAPVLPEGYSYSHFIPGVDNHAWCECLRGGCLIDGRDDEQAYREEIINFKDIEPENDIWFLDYKGEHIGTATSFVHKAENVGDMHQVGIRSDFRGRGLAKYLSYIVIKTLFDRGVKYISLTTGEGRAPAVKSYLSAGFLPVEYDVGMQKRWELVLEMFGIDEIQMLNNDASPYKVIRRSGLGESVCMIAHRGYSGKYHENTALAFEKAHENGSGGAETDVRVSKDGVLVLSHNSTAVLLDGTELEVSEHTFAELTAQPLRNKRGDEEVYLCSFEEYLAIMKKYNMVCFIELKGPWSDEKINECFTMCREKYDISKCILQSFDFDNLLKARRLFPDLPIMLTYGTGEVADGWQRCIDNGFSIDADKFVMTPEMVRAFSDAGLVTGVWTVNDEEQLARCRALGVDYIESDIYGG